MDHLRVSAGVAGAAAEASAAPSAASVALSPASGAGVPSCGAEPPRCFSRASLWAFSRALSAGMIRSASLGLGGLRWEPSRESSMLLRLPRPPRLRLDSLRSWPWPALHV